MTPSTTRETERKYEATDEVRLPSPHRLLGRDRAAGNQPAAEDQKLDAVYFDTPDLALARAGITLRRREGGSDPGWHLKLPVGTDSRDELRVPTRGAGLSPVLRLRTRRRRWLLADGDGRPLAELAEDRVTAQTLGQGTDTTRWREIEVELAEHGSVELLDRIEKQLLKAGARRSGAASKLSRPKAAQSG